MTGSAGAGDPIATGGASTPGDTAAAGNTAAAGDTAAAGNPAAAGNAIAVGEASAAGSARAAGNAPAGMDGVHGQFASGARVPAHRTVAGRTTAWFGRLSRLRRALLIGAVALVLVPILVIADSYLIVRDVRPLAREAPRETRVMRDRRADQRTPQPLRQRWVGLGAMSPHLVHSVVVHEDATFFEHGGFDEFEIKAALRRSWAERRLVRGASTITTQLARNLYLGTGRSLFRKLREIPLTVRLERALSKRRILELYLNYAEWGPGVFGAEAASRYHFKTAARNLSPARAALLTAALPSPRRSTPARPSPYLRRRAAIILTRLEARGWLTAAELQAARQELGLRGPAPDTPFPEEVDPGREEPPTGSEAGEPTPPEPVDGPPDPGPPGPAPAPDSLGPEAPGPP